jgi:Glu-tRNA(Gln) amidotransferase subunit E-like FAD-binding protein
MKKTKETKGKGELILTSGLEIHQQIDAGKLFCKCPSMLRQDKPDYEVTRKLHVIKGESGNIDEAVTYEAGRERVFLYQGYRDNCCLVELDEAPPYNINEEALGIGLQIALLLNCEIVQDAQIMRKTVINGSNTSGFQRSVLIARNGHVETSFGKVAVDYVFLEEDSARPAGKDEEDEQENKERATKYKLDRLGIPLVEIATGPHMHTPEQIKECALKIGEILRACKVRRGIGTIRQDLNISIKNDGKESERVEIKGFQDPSVMIETVNKEIERQRKCLKENKCSREVRRANPDGTTGFLRPMPGAARMYPETDLPLLHIHRDLINEAKRTLPRLKQEIKQELKQEGLSEELIKLILEDNKVLEYKELLGVYKNPNLIAKMLVLWQKELASKEKVKVSEIEKKLSIDLLESILVLIRDKKIEEGMVKKIMEDIVKGKSIEDALKVEKVSGLEDEIVRIVKEKPGLSSNAYMGLVMSKFKGKVSGKEVMEILKKLVKS